MKIGFPLRTAIAAVLTIGMASTISTASQAAGADTIKQRQAAMKMLGKQMGGIKAALKAGNGAAVAKHANIIASIAAKISSLTPKGSGPEAGKTRARPKIWQEWDKYLATAKALETEAKALVAVAASNDRKKIGAQFGKMAGRGCGSCHKQFRAPKKK